MIRVTMDYVEDILSIRLDVVANDGSIYSVTVPAKDVHDSDALSKARLALVSELSSKGLKMKRDLSVELPDCVEGYYVD